MSSPNLLAKRPVVDDNWGMSSMRTIEVSSEFYETLETEAKAMGLTVPAYVQFLEKSRVRGHDATFADAAKHVFSSYPQTLKKLAQ